MGKWVILELHGDFNISGFRATLEIRPDHGQPTLKVTGFLPPAPAVASQLHNHWHEVYRPLGIPLRIKGQKIIHKGSINQRLLDCQRSAQALCDQFKDWLNAESFQPIDRRLREELSRYETIYFLIKTQDSQLPKLPWHEWDFFERYPYAELALGTPEYESGILSPGQESPHPVRILAILGHSQGINVEADRRLLSQLPQAQVTFLVEPDRQQLNDRLWATTWDILFFAGHSETHRDQGRIFINRTDSLTLSELRYGLRQAIHQGLKLAIFNSCDGLGLVRELHSLQMPQMIVMREPVADQVAEAFLKHFLTAFAAGDSLYLAERKARERLQGLEDQFPCASWLPLIYQNPLASPPNWQTLQGYTQTQDARADSPPPPRLPASQTLAMEGKSGARWLGLAIAAMVTLVVLILRLSGLLQPFELAAYDHMMRSRPAETLDSRLLVVEVTQADLNEFGGYPLGDAILAQTIEALQEFGPVAMGIDMHRYRPRGVGRQALLDTFRKYPNLLTVCAFDQVDQDYGPPVEFSDQQRNDQVGFSNFLLDDSFQSLTAGPRAEPQLVRTLDAGLPHEGKKVRRHLLSYAPNLATRRSACSTPYSLSFQLAYRFLDQAEIQPLTVTADGHWQLGDVALLPLPRHFGAYQNLDGLSTQVMINYRSAQPGQTVSLQQVLDRQVDEDLVRNRLVLVGYTAPVARDTADTPYGKMAGVWVHAHMASQLISAVQDRRPLIKTLPQWRQVQWGDAAWILVWALVGGSIAGWLQSRRWSGSKRVMLLGLALGSVGLLWGLAQVSIIALSQGIWLPFLPTVLSVIVTLTGVVIWRISRMHHH